MREFFHFKMDVATSVEDIIRNSKQNSVLIITIKPVKSGGYFVTIVTDESSEDTPTETSSSKPEST